MITQFRIAMLVIAIVSTGGIACAGGQKPLFDFPTGIAQCDAPPRTTTDVALCTGKMWVETARRSAPETVEVWQDCSALNEKMARLRDDRVLTLEQFAGGVEYLFDACRAKANEKRAQHPGR
jgi:hypothetical protein